MALPIVTSPEGYGPIFLVLWILYKASTAKIYSRLEAHCMQSSGLKFKSVHENCSIIIEQA